VQHSIRIDSFCVEDELFFASYETEQVNAGRSMTLAFDAVEAQPPTAEQRAHFTRFHRPVAWVITAMASLSLVALVQRGLQQNSRREVLAHVGPAPKVQTAAAAKKLAAVSAVPSRPAHAIAAEQTSESPWSWIGLHESVLALVREPAPPDTSAGKLSSLADSVMQASLVNDYTSALLSMCRNAPS